MEIEEEILYQVLKEVQKHGDKISHDALMKAIQGTGNLNHGNVTKDLIVKGYITNYEDYHKGYLVSTLCKTYTDTFDKNKRSDFIKNRVMWATLIIAFIGTVATLWQVFKPNATLQDRPPQHKEIQKPIPVKIPLLKSQSKGVPSMNSKAKKTASQKDSV